MRKFVLFPLALLLLCSVASADFNAFEQESGTGFSDNFQGWIPLAVSALLLCLFFNVLVYMAGMAFESDHLKRYAKSEFLQTTAGSLMIFFAVALLYGLTSGSAIDLMGEAIGKGSTVACAAADGGQYRVFGSVQFGGGPLGAFKCKVQEKITALDSAYRNIAQENKPTELWTSVCFSLFGAPVWCGDWDEERHMEVEIAHYTATRIVSLLMPLHAQYVLAEYLQKNMLSVFLPIGLLLRILPFTRGIGGLFIALSVGFFFIFPTFFILTDPTYVRADERLQDRIGGICYSGFKGATVLVYNIFNLQGSSGAGSLASARGADLVYQVSIATVFYPFIALVLTLAFVRALTPLLGGDLGELMKMVSRLG
jgi:hypothetical protein